MHALTISLEDDSNTTCKDLVFFASAKICRIALRSGLIHTA